MMCDDLLKLSNYAVFLLCSEKVNNFNIPIVGKLLSDDFGSQRKLMRQKQQQPELLFVNIYSLKKNRQNSNMTHFV